MHPRAIVRRLRIALGAWLIDVGVRVRVARSGASNAFACGTVVEIDPSPRQSRPDLGIWYPGPIKVAIDGGVSPHPYAYSPEDLEVLP